MPDQHRHDHGREVMYAIRHPDGQPIGHDEEYAFLIVERPDDWDAAADNSHDHPHPLDYELVRLVVEPVATRTYADGHRLRSAEQAASTTPRATRQPTDPATPARDEALQAIRRADGHGVGMEDAYEYIPVENDTDDPWDIATRLSRGDLGQVTYELIEVTYRPVLRRTYRDGHDIDDVPKDTRPAIKPCPGQTSLLAPASADREANADG